MYSPSYFKYFLIGNRIVDNHFLPYYIIQHFADKFCDALSPSHFSVISPISSFSISGHVVIIEQFYHATCAQSGTYSVQER